MSPASRRAVSRWWAGPVAAVVVAVVAAVALAPQGSGPPSSEDPSSTTSTPAADEAPSVEVSSDAPRLTTLTELVAAADLVVQGEVEATERGRTFGAPGGASLESRLITLRVDEVLAGGPPQAGTVLVEEEGWLDDGRALVVDGAAPTEPGDRGFWFLVEVDDPDMPVYRVVNAEGRYLLDGEATLVGATGDDPLIATVEALGPEALPPAVAAAAAAAAG